MFLLCRILLMSYYSNNNTSFCGLLNENLNNPSDAAYAREWNKMLKEKSNSNNNNSYGSSYGGSLQTTTCNWGGFSNGSSVFSSSYYG